MGENGEAMLGWVQWDGTNSYNFLGQEYNSGHWYDIKSYGGTSDSNYDPAEGSLVKMNECRKIVFWTTPNDGKSGTQDQFLF